MTTFVDRETTVEASWLNMVDGIATDPAVVALAGVTPAADKLPYFTGPAAAALADFTATGRAIVSQPNVASVLSVIGGAPTDSPTFTTKLTLGGAGFRFIGDFSNATVASRALFKTSTTNGVTSVCAIPDGSSTTSAWVAYNTSDPANASYTYLGTTAADSRIVAAAAGTGTNLPLKLYTSNIERVAILADGKVGVGTSTPSTTLHVKGTGIVSAAADSLSGTFHGIGHTWLRSADWGDINLQLGNNSGAEAFRWYKYDATELAKMDYAGNFEIKGSMKFNTAGSRIYLKGTASAPTDRTLMQCHETNQNTVFGVLPNGTATLAAVQMYNASDLTGAFAYVDLRSGSSEHSITSQALNGGTALPLSVKVSGKTNATFLTSGWTEFGSASYDSRVKIFQRRDLSNPYGLIIAGYNTTFENDFFMGMTASGFDIGNYQNFGLNFKTNNTNRFQIANDGKVTFTTADSAGPQWLFSGTTKGARIYTSSVGTAIEGVDNTGTGSYQPLIIGGSYAAFTVSGNEKARVTANGTLASRTTGYMNRTSQSTSTTTHTIDFTASNYYQLTMGHNIATLTLTAPEYPCVVQLDIIQDATGSRTMAWPTSLKWPSNYATADKTISTAANARDLLILRWNGTDYVANLMKGIA